MVQEYFNHPLLFVDKLKFRQYQQDLLQKIMYKNSLVVIPTSLGKTVVTLLLCLNILYNWKSSKILILAPTRPLVYQHFNLFKNYSIVGNICIPLTGKIKPEVRKTIWRSTSYRVYFATPELVRNDLKNNIINKDDFFLVVFDEAHRAVKEYSYTFISKKFYDNTSTDRIPMILALTASPGSSDTKIMEICDNLHIEQIQIKSEHDKDVLPYVYHVDVESCLVEMSELQVEISNILQSIIDEKISWLIDNHFIRKKKNIHQVYRKDLLDLGNYLKSKIDSINKINSFSIFAALKYQSMAMILFHCRDLIQSQGLFAFKKFFNKVNGELSTRTYQEILSDNRIISILEKINNIDKLSHSPKIEKLLSLIYQYIDVMSNTEPVIDKIMTGNDLNLINRDTIIDSNMGVAQGFTPELKTLKQILFQKKVLIFSQYRDTLEEIISVLSKIGIPCKGFFGQSDKEGTKGLNQEEQLQIIEEFKKGSFPVLVATSVAEEGLDIPNVDTVIFYEPVASEIRFIQRKGRTGRFSNGKVVILTTKDSIDSKYLQISKKKISKMKSALSDVNLILHPQLKRKFDKLQMMNLSEISNIGIGGDMSNDQNDSYDPIMDAILSNSNKKIKYFVTKLAYNKPLQYSERSKKNLQDLYEISLELDNKKTIEKIQRQLHELLGKSGKNGLDLPYIYEILSFDKKLIDKAISNLEKLKRVVWLDSKTIALKDSIAFIRGHKYFIVIEKMMMGKAIVLVNDRWYALLDHFDYSGPRTLLKKGNSFNIIGDVYKKGGKLHLMVKKII